MAKSQRMSARQREAKLEAARQREQRVKEQQEHKDRLKKAGIIAVCVVLALALGLPTMALMVMGGGA